MQAVLLLNLGSPDSPNIPDVRAYLQEFLSDKRVLDAPFLIRKLILHCLILPFRPKKSAHAYSTIWTPEGSPLIVTSKKQQSLLQTKLDIPVALAMRYGKPSIEDVIQGLCARGVTDLFIAPLYPHYAMSSYETVVVRTMECIHKHAPSMQTTLLQPFFKDTKYIDALVASAKPYLQKEFDYLLFTFHGLPKRHLKKTDCSGYHCLKTPYCCQTAHPAHATCYKHQCLQTADAFVKKMGLLPHQYGISFQSRLLNDPWLDPFTDHTIVHLAKTGTKRLLVISPSFVSDCLETLEEIAISGKESFLNNGGQSFELIPCLNDHPAFIDFLLDKINAWKH